MKETDKHSFQSKRGLSLLLSLGVFISGALLHSLSTTALFFTSIGTICGYPQSVQGRLGEPHCVVLFNTSVPFNVTELVGRTVKFVNYEKHGTYSWIELANMHLAYGAAAFTNGRAAQGLYLDRYTNRRITHHTTFSSIHRRLCQSGTVHRRVDGKGWGVLCEHAEE